jgi:hypothetical protein
MRSRRTPREAGTGRRPSSSFRNARSGRRSPGAGRSTIRAADLWANMARDLARQPEKLNTRSPSPRAQITMCMLHAGRRQWLKVFPRPFFQDLTFIGRSTEHRDHHFRPLKRDCTASSDRRRSLITIRRPSAEHPRRARTVMGAAGATAHGLRATRGQRANLAEQRPHPRLAVGPNQTYQICREISTPPAKYEAMRRAGYQECWTNFPHANAIDAATQWPDWPASTAQGRNGKGGGQRGIGPRFARSIVPSDLDAG